MSQFSQQIIQKLQDQANPDRAKQLQRFFKTGPGEYAEGDLFLGIPVPQLRALVRQFKKKVVWSDIQPLLIHPHHEMRLTGLLLLVELFQASDQAQRKNLVDQYLTHSAYINNWDLVDLSTPKILGQYLLDTQPQTTPQLLIRLAHSSNLWERRIAMLATYAYIKADFYQATLDLAVLLINDPHDLIHKASGWMLREVGKRDQAVLEQFLDEYGPQLPRTALRYSIERLPENKRQLYLGKK